ncbi:MAG: hypothetical protein SFY69_08410 [Planctomycetota bacterium]|nr:hypothetical protein [Planctomycetota bacterium]
MKKFMGVCALVALAGVAQGQVQFNEIFVNAPGTDQGREFIELLSAAPNQSLDGLTILVIEGDCGSGCVAGTIDQALSLTGQSTGANRLFMWRDSTDALIPEAEPATAIFVQDFSPDIENGSNTYLIVEGFTGAVGDDLDANNDGVLDSQPWTRVVDAVGYKEGDNRDTHLQYSTQLGGPDVTDYIRPGTSAFTPDTLMRLCGGWVTMDVLGGGFGPWVADPNETLFVPDNGQVLNPNFTLTPGAPNIECESAPPCEPDFNQDGNVDQDDIACLAQVVAGDPSCSSSDPDFNRDGNVDQDDIAGLEQVVAGQPCP